MSQFCAGWDFSSKLPSPPSQHPSIGPSISYRPFWVDTKLAENQPRYGPSGRESAGSVLDLEVATRHLTQPASRCQRDSARSHLVSRKKNGFCRLSVFLPLPILRPFSRSLVSHMSGVFFVRGHSFRIGSAICTRRVLIAQTADERELFGLHESKFDARLT